MTAMQRQGLKMETNNRQSPGDVKDGGDNSESGDYGNFQTDLISKDYKVCLVKN